MDNLQQTLTVAASLVALIVVVAGVLVFVRGAYGNARIQALREDNDDLRKRHLDVEAEKDIWKTRAESLASENTILKDLTLQKANVDALRNALLAHNADSLERLNEYRDVLINALRNHDEKMSEKWDAILRKLENGNA